MIICVCKGRINIIIIGRGNYTEIRNKLTSTDTAWIKTRLVKTAAVEASICLYELFHEYNKELEKLIAQLKAQSKKAKGDGNDIIMEGDCTC